MTTNITTSDLTNYANLRSHLYDLYIKISNGKREVVQGNEKDFIYYYRELFPETTKHYSDNKLSCTTMGQTEMNDKTISLKHLLHNTLYPTFYPTKNTGSPNYDKRSNDHIGPVKKDHLCFIKLASGSNDIEPDEHVITNILYSIYVIEIFLKIIAAFINCYDTNEKNLINLFSSTTPIFIVNKKLKHEHTVDEAKGIFIDKASNDADSPINGIYLYIGNLSKMFNADDLVIINPRQTEDTVPDASTKTSYLATDNTYIFNSNNKLHTLIGSNNIFYFGSLNYMNNYDGESVYIKQTGTTTGTYKKNNIPGTMTLMKLDKAKISTGTINSANITKLKILKGSTITKVGNAGVYKVTQGYINCTVTSGTLASDATISTDTINNVTITNNSVFTATDTASNAGATVDLSKTEINNKSDLITKTPITISESITLFSNNVTDLQFTYTGDDLGSINQNHKLENAIDASDISSATITITNAIISSPTVSIAGNFDNINIPNSLDNTSSYYKQNIYYIYSFLKMINNIDNNHLLTTLQYLDVQLLCFKSLLLSSIRAANIFYNNRFDMSAVAISYEENFLTKSSDTSNAECAKLELNNFIKNKNNAKFSSTASCNSSAKLPYDTTVVGQNYKYILYKKSQGDNPDNDIIFKEYDVRIQKEIDNIKTASVKTSASNVGIISFILSHNFKVNSSFTISTDNGNANDHLDKGGIFEQGAGNDYDKIITMFNYNKKHEFNKNYRIKIEGTTFKVLSFNIITETDRTSKRVVIELEENNAIPQKLFKELKEKKDDPINKHVSVVKITSQDIDKDYNNIVSNTDTVEQNINMYKTKIKNNTTLYELHKSRNNLLYNQILSYLIIVVILISILVIINIANVEKPLIKSITLGCLAVIIILFMSYYIMNTIYIEESFSLENNFIGYELCKSDSCVKSEISVRLGEQKQEHTDEHLVTKKNNVKNFLDTNSKELMLMIILKSPSIVNDSLKGNNEKLVSISKNIYNEKLYLNDVLYSKKSDSEMNVDVLKYENKNYDVYIVCILFLALIIIGSYTVNIYTDNKYLDLLILIMVILFVCLFTYFVLYTNRIVRTISTNYYWGNEYENEYI